MYIYVKYLFVYIFICIYIYHFDHDKPTKQLKSPTLYNIGRYILYSDRSIKKNVKKKLFLKIYLFACFIVFFFLLRTSHLFENIIKLIIIIIMLVKIQSYFPSI